MWLLDDLLLEQIVKNLPLKDVLSCLCVCKHWKDVLSSNTFWKMYTLHHFDFTDEEQPSGNLFTWTDPNCWFCYWNWKYDDDYRDDEEEEEGASTVFYTPPRRWRSTGIVHPASFDVYNTNSIPCYKDFAKCVTTLKKMGHGSLVEYTLFCYALGNESGGTDNLEVCLFPWQHDRLPDDKDIAKIFTFNKNMMAKHASRAKIDETFLELKVDEEKSNRKRYYLGGHQMLCDDDGTKDSRVYDFMQWLRKLFKPTVFVYFGLEKMNPVPYFILTRLAPGWMGGFLTWVTCT